MDYCQQLEAKYPNTFNKLIDQHKSLSSEKDRNKTRKLIKNLLKVDSWHGRAILMYLKGYKLSEIGREANFMKY